MGNMSNPCINRWGMNTFWYNFWYSDNNYASQVKQDKIFIKLINIYLIYGLSVPHNVFANLYWYAKHFKKLDFPSYFRWFTTKDTGRGKVETYAIRKSIDCVFPMRLWLLRYDNWLIINLYWFRPFKNKKRHSGFFDRSTHDTFHLQLPETTNAIRKLKTLLSVEFFNYVVTKSYYKF